MTNVALLIIFAIAPIGAFDAIYYHVIKQKLALHPESWRETQTHIIRSFVMGAIVLFLSVYNVHGNWFWIVGWFFGFDLLNNVIDVYLEQESRRSQGGMPRLEPVIHIVGATGMGLVTAAYFYEFWPAQFDPSGLSAHWTTLGLPMQINSALIILGSVALALLETGLMVSSMMRGQSCASPCS